MESLWSKDMMKEALSELLQEMPIFKNLSAGSSSQPSAAVPGPSEVPGPSTDPEGGKAVSKSSKCGRANS